MKIGICVSGQLGFICLKHLLETNKSEKFAVCWILTDKNSTTIIGLAEQFQIPVFKGNPRNDAAFNFLLTFESKIDVLLSINYLFILENKILNYSGKYSLNFHGSLLPKYRGRTPHVWAIINGEKHTGVSVHLMSENVDQGDIVLQRKISINRSDTGAIILEKYFQEYPLLLDELIHRLEAGTILGVPQKELNATYFGKRTPEDGLVNWNWQKDRIYNWVRALSEPYPGAFTFYMGKKIIFHKCKFTDLGFDSIMENGLIVKINKSELFIKVQNGVIKIGQINNFNSVEFETGKVLG